MSWNFLPYFMAMVPSKGRLSRMLVLTTVQFGHRKGRDKFMDAFIKHGNWFKNRGVLETLKMGEGRKAGRLGGFYCRADKSYWILELREGGFFHWTVASLCRVNNTREYETVVNTQKFNLEAVRISSCILIQFHLYNVVFPQDSSSSVPQGLSCSEQVFAS